MNQVIKKNFEINKTKAEKLRSMGISGLFMPIDKKRIKVHLRHLKISII